MPGTPTRAEIQTQIGDDLDALDSVRTGAANFLTDAGTAEQSREGDHLPRSGPELMASVRASLSAILSPATARRVWVPGLREFGKLIDSPGMGPNPDIQRLAIDLYHNMHDNSQTVNGRNITRGSPSAGGSNVGDGILARLTQDWNQYPLEAGVPEVHYAVCRRDGLARRYGAEEFEFYGGDAAPDFAEQLGSGLRNVLLPVLHAGTSGPGASLVRNPSFDVEHGTTDADTAKVSSWTISSGATSLEESSTIAMAAPGVTVANSRSLEFEADAKIVQSLDDVLRRYLSDIYMNPRPLFGAVLLNRQSSCDGTFSLKIGSQAVTVDVTTLTNGAWTWHVWKTDQSCWPQAWLEDDVDIELELSSRTTGTLLVDNLVCNFWTPFNGTFYALRGGTTHFLNDDIFTITDTGGALADAEVQWMYAHAMRSILGWRAYLPSNNAGTETWSDF